MLETWLNRHVQFNFVAILILVSLSALTGLITHLLPTQIVFATIVLMFVIGLLIWLSQIIGILSTVAISGIILSSGFLGTFYESIFVQLINNVLRWIVPLLFLLISLPRLVSPLFMKKNFFSIWGKATLPLALFLGYNLISTSYSSSQYTTFGRALTFTAITLGMACTMLFSVRSLKDAEKSLRTIAILMAVIVIPGQIYLFFPGSVGWHSSGRFRSTFWNPVTYSHLLAILFPLYVWCVTDRRLKLVWRSLALVMSLFLIVNMLLTGSRTGTFALAIGALCLLWFLSERRGFSIRQGALLMGVSFLIGFVALNPETILSYFTRDNDLYDLNTLTSTRFSVWEVGLTLWKQAPLIGSGFGNITLPDYLPQTIINLPSSLTANVGYRLSNLYLETLVTGGIFGLTLLFSVVSSFAWTFISSARTSTGPNRRLFIVGLTIFITGLILNSTETWMVSAGSPFAMYWWFVLFVTTRPAVFDQHSAKTNVAPSYKFVSRSVIDARLL